MDRIQVIGKTQQSELEYLVTYMTKNFKMRKIGDEIINTDWKKKVKIGHEELRRESRIQIGYIIKLKAERLSVNYTESQREEESSSLQWMWRHWAWDRQHNLGPI